MIRRTRFLLPLLLIVAPFAEAASPSASLGWVLGRVVDRDGHPLAGVSVVLTLTSGDQTEILRLTDALGGFRFEGIPQGQGYRLRLSLPAYQTLEFSEVEVEAGETRLDDIVLHPALTERVTVRAAPDVVRTDSAVTRTEISGEFLEGLPILGRDYQDILTLAPGVTDVDHTGNPNIHGARDTDVLTLVDGINTTDPYSGHYGQELNSESIQDIEIITAGATAEYSRAQGGFVNILTKSGGNEFKGSFRMFLRSYRLDGDGAGIDPGELRGGVGERDGFRDLRFTDLYPFLSASGPVERDHLWYYAAPEFVQVEEPVNAGTQAFIQRTRSLRATGKLTWQMTPSQKLSLLGLFDATDQNNQGLDSRTLPESGYSFHRGGPTTTLQQTALVSASLALETSLSRFDQSFSVIPTLDADTNGNGILFVDDNPRLGGNQDGFLDARERDPGEDYDADGRFDLFEDFNRNGSFGACFQDPETHQRVCANDLDRDGRLTGPNGCEGREHEDVNCNGSLDRETDLNMNGEVDPQEDTGIPCQNELLCPEGIEPGTRGNGRLDSEDRNGNQRLDTVGNSGRTSFPFWVDRNGNGIPERGEFLAPEPADRDYRFADRNSGPFYFDYSDHRTRDTLREEISFFVPDRGGSHDLKLGGLLEQEGFSRLRHQRPILQPSGLAQSLLLGQTVRTIGVLLPTRAALNNRASGDHFGLFLQDTYKPLTNLTLGLGLRFDRETIGAWGYEPFDPSAERRQFDHLMGLAGVEIQSGDLNSDGILAFDLSGDPLYGPGSTRVLVLDSNLALAAPRHFTRHNYLTPIFSSALQTLGVQDPLVLQGGRPRQRQDFSITNNNLAPRLSVTWDPLSKGKSKGFASWGRFYGNLFLQTVVGEQGPDLRGVYYVYDPGGVTDQGLPDHQLGDLISGSPPSATQVDRNLKTPFTDEMTLGWEQEIAPEVSLSLTYVRRRYREQLQDIDINHTIRRPPFCKQTVTPAGYCDDFGITLPPPSGVRDAVFVRMHDSYPDLYIQNLDFNQIFRVGNFNYQDYLSYELHLVRRIRRRWQFDASYVFSKGRGQAESFLSESGDDPALTELKDGYLSYDQRHVAKFHAVAYLPHDWQLGGGVTWSSGLPYSLVNRFQSNDNVEFIQTRRLFGHLDPNTHFFYSETRNSHRNPPTYDLGVRTQRNFVLGKAAAGAFFEVYNLLNTDDLRVQEIDNRRFSLQADETRRFGRRFQLGLQLQF